MMQMVMYPFERKPLRTLAAAACVALSACARGAADGEGPACIVSPAALARMARVPVRNVDAQGERCTYTFESGQQLIVITHRRDIAAQWKGIVAGSTLLNAGSPAKPPKIGDATVWQAAGALLFVRKGDAYAQIDLRAAPGDPLRLGPAIARAGLARL